MLGLDTAGRSALLLAARSARVKGLVTTLPFSRDVVDRFVAGTGAADAVRVTTDLEMTGLAVSLDHLGEDTTDLAQAEATVAAYEVLLAGLAEAGLAHRAEVSIKLTALGLDIDASATEHNAARVVAAATKAGTTVTVDMEDHTRTDATLEIVRTLRSETPTVGTVLQSYLHRTEADARDLAHAGSRIRLCKGAYKEPASVAFQSKREVDLSYARCLGILMSGAGYPMVATHDPALVNLAERLVKHTGRLPSTYELQMLYGIRPAEQTRLAADGHTVRVYVPYGDEWYGYLMRRLAERPANLVFFAHALTSRS